MITAPLPRKGAVAVAGLLALTGCVSPARTGQDYRGKASQTATSLISVLSTAALVAAQLEQHRIAVPLAKVATGNAEEDGAAIATAFDSVQPPPTSESDALRAHVDDLMTSANSALADLRIAVRRRDMSGVARSRQDMEVVLPRLQPIADLG